MIVLKYNFDAVFINIYNNVFVSKTFWSILFGNLLDKYFPPPRPRQLDLLYFIQKSHS